MKIILSFILAAAMSVSFTFANSNVDPKTAYIITEKFSEEAPSNAQHCPQSGQWQSILAGLFCHGSHCDNLQLLCSYESFVRVSERSYKTLGYGEEKGLHICPDNYVLTGLECSDAYCGKVHLECKQLINDSIDYDYCDSTEWVAKDGAVSVPGGAFPIGVECADEHCGKKKIHYCSF